MLLAKMTIDKKPAVRGFFMLISKNVICPVF